MTENKAIVTDGFRKEPFTAEVTDFSVGDIGGYNKVFFEFTDGPGLSIFPPKEIHDFQVPGYMDLGVLIRSLQDQGIDTILDVDDDTLELIGIRTEPDICGKTLSFDVKTKDWINKEGVTKTNYEWRVTSIEGNSLPSAPKAAEPQEKPQAPKEQESNQDNSKYTSLWEEIILEVLDNGTTMSEGGLMKAMKIKVPDKSEQKAMNDCRRSVLETMAVDGIIKKEGNEFKLV